MCHNRRIGSHKVMAEFAARGKTSMGWFYGFKLHLVINDQGELLKVKITAGNVDDRDPVPELTRSLFGKLFGDRGYISQSRFEQLWEHGVQLYSLSAEADARVRLWTQAEVATQMNLTRFPPDISLDPEITAARLEIPDFRIRRLGEFHGPLVRSLSHATREALEEKLADDNEKLVAKLNRAIDKHEKKLTLSLADVMKSKWSGLVGQAEK